ncbi:MAG: thioredoxin family protein [Tannerella sp.]|jgi:thiol-disulfide isomerase/thioredoxin|nr:thioredoxin family protein [Tannerella sp.]
MKHIKIFYLSNCRFCRQAFSYIEQLKEQDQYKDIEIDLIEESEEPDMADRYDYYFVPAFYFGDEKLSEGSVTVEEVEKIFQKIVNSD